MEDPSRPVTGYPAAAYPPAQSNTNPNPNGHPRPHPTYTTTGTAYPYAAPPPQSNYYNPNPYYPSRPYNNQRATIFRRLFAVIIALFIITGTVIFIVWLVLRPRIPEFRVDSVSLSNFSVNASLISGNWDVGFTVRNPNHKINLYYDHIEASVLHKSDTLATTTLPPFDQGTKNETAARATFAAASTYVSGWVVNDINQERTSGSVRFNFGLYARVRFKAGAWRARRRFLRVYCKDLHVGITSNSAAGKLTDGPRQCRVDL
ncbi:NDR1/HIN1-like protein 10 [Cornus florida]|uniref:NDR1/HIN1-like protein 10 n=1 Tax=Cornus florida TaxID=4283 RepID=UPI0028A0B54B|nr:NDR1/HIN1-like protein 10 [Cornus florida]